MRIIVKNEAPFQILTSAMSIGPSPTGYNLEVSADGKNFSPLFSVAANTTKMATGLAPSSYYRLKNNVGDVVVNWSTYCVIDGGGGGDMSNYYTKQETDAEISAATSPIEEHLDDVEHVTATALTELHDAILEISGSTYTKAETDAEITGATAGFMTSAATQGMIEEATSGITEDLNDVIDMMQTKEEVVAAALVDLDQRKVESQDVHSIVKLTQAEYDLIASPDPDTLYIIINNQ